MTTTTRLLGLAALVLACKPEPATQPPEPVSPPSTPVADDPTPQDTDDAPSGVPTETPPSEPGEPPVATTEPTPSEPTPAEPTPVAPLSGKDPLPTAISTRIDAKCGSDPGVNTPAKPFSLKTPEGKDISLASYRGKVVLLNFWGTWCKPCLKELPEFDRLYRRYRKHGLVVIAIATDTEPEKVQEFATERKLAVKLALGGEPLADQYESTNFPFSFVIDAKGQIRGSYRGYKPECAGKLEQDIRTQLETLR